MSRNKLKLGWGRLLLGLASFCCATASLSSRAAFAQAFTPPDAKFIVSQTQDAWGSAWIGTEDKGVFHYDPALPNGKQWANFTTKDGLGDDNAYALCIDKLGRVWCGHLNHGVSVYNGKTWKNYDVLDGPIGERIFSLATDPTNGDVWIATSAGMTRYSLDKDNWTHFTRADGLPSDQVQSLAFDAKGTLYAGTQCHGLAISDPVKEIPPSTEKEPAEKVKVQPQRTWRTVVGSDALPLVPAGKGLPSNLINQVLVARDGGIYVATTCGLAASKDKGKNWTFVRGADWAGKVKGLYGGPPAGWKETQAPFLLLEDYCTCLAEDEAGFLWIGHRQKGYEVINSGTLQRQYSSLDKEKTPDGKNPLDYVFSMLVRPGQPTLIGWYMHGLTEGAPSLQAKKPTPVKPADKLIVTDNDKHPSLAAPPSLEELNNLLAKLGKIPLEGKKTQPSVFSLEDDWRTQGDWLGRYGRFWACLCAIDSPQNVYRGPGDTVVKFNEMIGPHCDRGDSIRYWVHWLYSDNPKVLEMPPEYLGPRLEAGMTTPGRDRRQAEVDDHGETYSMNRDGPHLFYTIWVPPGNYRLGLYFFNKDGNYGHNRFRDFLVKIKAGRFSSANYGDTPSGQELVAFDRAPLLAQSRVRDFWGGVYKRFCVEGPGWYSIQVDRNSSFCTICSSVMLDMPEEFPPPYYWPQNGWGQSMPKKLDDRASNGLGRVLRVEDIKARLQAELPARELIRDEIQNDKPTFFARFSPGTASLVTANRVYSELQWLPLRNAPTWEIIRRQYALSLAQYYRPLSEYSQSSSVNPQILDRLGSCKFQISFFGDSETISHFLGKTTIRDMEQSKKSNSND